MMIIKRMLINWKKGMFDKMVSLDNELALQNWVFVEEIDKFITKIGKIEKQMIKQWEETCEIMSNPDIMKGLISSLKDIEEGKFYVLSKENGEIKLTKGKRIKKK